METNAMTKHGMGSALGALTVLCWSGYNVAAKHGIDNGFSPESLAFLRFAVPGVIALPTLAVLRFRGKLPGIPIGRLMVLIALGGPVFGWVAVRGYAHAPLSHGLLFAPVAVFLVSVILGGALLNERMTTRRISGAAVMFTGLATLVGLNASDLGASWAQGIALFVLAGSMWGAYTVLLRYWNIPMIEGALAVAAGSTLVAAPLLGSPAVEALRAVSLSSLMAQSAMQGVVGGVISVVALIGAVRTLSVQMVALLPVFTPVVALGVAWAAFGSVPTAAEITGVAIIAVGFLMSAGLSFADKRVRFTTCRASTNA